MKKEDTKDIARGITALCVRDAWNEELCSPHEKSEEMRRYMKDVMNRIYTVLTRVEDPDFMRKLSMYGSLISPFLGKPEEVQGLLDQGLVAQVDRMAAATQNNEKQ
jgi:hypothetical protein